MLYHKIGKDTQSSEELLLISYFFYFKKRNHNCIAWENRNFVNATFKRQLIAYERTSKGNIKFGK